MLIGSNITGWIVGLVQGEHQYCINGVNYIVKSKFEHPREGRPVRSAIKHIISSDMIDLLILPEEDRIPVEYVCSAAEKEECI